MKYALRWVGDGQHHVAGHPQGDIEVATAAERDRLLAIRSPHGKPLWVLDEAKAEKPVAAKAEKAEKVKADEESVEQ